MNKVKSFMHENKVVLSLVLIVGSLLVTILAIFGMPDEDGADGSGPLAPLRGVNFIFILAMLILSLVGFYVFYKYNSDKSKFDNLINANSQAIFKRNQIELERFALRLTTKEEKIVLEAMKRYKIR